MRVGPPGDPWQLLGPTLIRHRVECSGTRYTYYDRHGRLRKVSHKLATYARCLRHHPGEYRRAPYQMGKGSLLAVLSKV